MSAKTKTGLAETWRTIDDLTWEFNLRRGVKFHDGSELTVRTSRSQSSAGKSNARRLHDFTRALTEKSSSILNDPAQTATHYPTCRSTGGLSCVQGSQRGGGADSIQQGTIGTVREIRALHQRRPHSTRAHVTIGAKNSVGQSTSLITSDPSRSRALYATCK